MPIFVAARMALARSRTEIRRQPADEERAALDEVSEAILRLQDAIDRAPVPRGFARSYELPASNGLDAAEVFIGWSDVKALRGAYRIAIVDVLRVATELVTGHIQSLPPRAVLRHRKRPQVIAFVRWMHYFALRAKAHAPAATIAAWANVALETAADDPVMQKDVSAMLRGVSGDLRGMIERAK
ncbi:MAG: hypothetical protein KDG57_05510 [Rhodoferax sp.]|nr:hypothetical protein [Rhodoferax sp.]